MDELESQNFRPAVLAYSSPQSEHEARVQFEAEAVLYFGSTITELRRHFANDAQAIQFAVDRLKMTFAPDATTVCIRCAQPGERFLAVRWRATMPLPDFQLRIRSTPATQEFVGHHSTCEKCWKPAHRAIWAHHLKLTAWRYGLSTPLLVVVDGILASCLKESWPMTGGQSFLLFWIILMLQLAFRWLMIKREMHKMAWLHSIMPRGVSFEGLALKAPAAMA